MLLPACSTGPGRTPPPGPGPLDRLDTAVRAVGSSRAAALGAVMAVQAGATALDATDQACTTGRGVAARTAYRQGAPRVARARAGLQDLSRLVASYRAALTSLAASRTAVSGRPRTALADAVRDGRAEADALERFRAATARLWPQYDALDGHASLWITRATASWYRTAREGAAAYAVLVTDTRRFLAAARTQLGAAAHALAAPSAAQTATLAAADTALGAVRGRG